MTCCKHGIGLDDLCPDCNEKTLVTDVKQIVDQWLHLNAFDGLCNAELECGCSVDDLAPCGQINEDCCAAYRWTYEKYNAECCRCPFSCSHCGLSLGCFRTDKQKPIED